MKKKFLQHKLAGEKEFVYLSEAFASIRKKIPYNPEVAIVLGSGLGDCVDSLKIDAQISYDEIKHFPRTTVKSHVGRFLFARINDVKVLILQGRIHYYEGYSPYETIRTIRLASLMGAKNLILTNAAGAINKNFKVGDIMIIKDHISFLINNPLLGKNVEEIGIRYPDMTEVYDKKYIKQIKTVAKRKKMNLKEGVYVQVTGPSFETPTEIKALRILGADAVGMSTVIEAIAARHSQMKILGLSVITNMASGIEKGLQTDEDVRKNAKLSSKKLVKLVIDFIKELKNKKLIGIN